MLSPSRDLGLWKTCGEIRNLGIQKSRKCLVFGGTQLHIYLDFHHPILGFAYTKKVLILIHDAEAPYRLPRGGKGLWFRVYSLWSPPLTPRGGKGLGGGFMDYRKSLGVAKSSDGGAMLPCLFSIPRQERSTHILNFGNRGLLHHLV